MFVLKRLVQHEFVIGLWKIHILHHAATEGVVGHHMLQELREHGYDASPGMLYPLLHRLERNGWLSTASADSPHSARTYVITPAGMKVLDELRRYVAELHRELSEEAAAINSSGTDVIPDDERRSE
jgi:PadR family transcriptional regulator, regulatory protein PadR